jgi:hypothetical protein
MSYDPQDHAPSPKQVFAAWVICLGIVSLALGLTIGRHDIAAVAVADPTHATLPVDTRPSAGVHIPEFAICRAEPDRRSSTLMRQQRGPMSAPENRC